MLDFSRQCGARLHRGQAGEASPGMLPTLSEMDVLITRSRQTLEALARMRNVVVSHEAALYQQAQDQAAKAQVDLKRNDSVYDEKSTDYTGGEAKKRRGVSRHVIADASTS